MRGQKELNPKIFYQFSLAQHVPENHLLRRLDAILDLSFIEPMTRGLYGYNGNQSVDPVVIVKMLLLGYLYNIHSVRELMRQIADRMSFRWFLGYDIDEPIPDHSVISKNMKRFGPELFHELFDQTVQQCVASELVGGKLVHIDSTTLKANASMKSVRPTHPDETFLPDLAPKDYWDALSKSEKQKHPGVNERMASTTDPEAAIITRASTGTILAHKDHRVVDDKRGIILATQTTSAAVTDERMLPSVLSDVIFRQGVLPEGVAADAIYGTVDNYRSLSGLGIAAYIPRQRPSSRPGRFSKEHFTYLHESDCYRCPAGELLKPVSKNRDGFKFYRGSFPVCRTCGLRDQCVVGKNPREVQRHVDEHYVTEALAKRDTYAFQRARKRRMTVIEGSFGEAKQYCAHDRARWRGRLKMQIQCYLVAAVQNLKKLLTYGWRHATSGVGIAPNSTYFADKVSFCAILAFSVCREDL